MLGVTITVPSHEGERELELPPGIQPGTRFALRGHHREALPQKIY